MIRSLGPSDVNRRVAYKVAGEEQVGSIADFNASYVHVRMKDGSSLPMPWGELRLIEDAGGISKVVRDAIASLVAQGLEATAIDANRIDVAGAIEWTPATSTYKVIADGMMGYGGLTAVVAAVAGLKAFRREECIFTYCPHPDRCQEHCASAHRAGQGDGTAPGG